MNYKRLFLISFIVNILAISLMQMQFNNSQEMHQEKEVYRVALYQKAQHDKKVIILAQYITKYSRIDHGRSKEYARYILAAAKKYDLDPKLLLVQIRTESNYRAHVVSYAGAVGLSQIMPYNCKNIPGCNSVRDLYNAESSIKFGAYWLRQELDKYQDTRKAIRAYNGGHGGVYRPKLETQNYEKKVFERYHSV